MAAAVLLAFMAACTPMKLGRQSVGDTFTDKRVAALTKAAVVGDVEKVALLASQGADVNTVAANGATPLVWALNARNHEGVEALLKAGADPNLVSDATGMSPMNFVPMGDDPELLRLLLEAGGNPNHPARTIDDRPLPLAARYGRIENMRLLLGAGADINAHDKFRQSAGCSSVDLGNFEATAFLLDHGFSYDLPYLARCVNVRQVPPASDAQRWKDKVLHMLEERGVK